ncbi:hypothetical protein diail_1468 [Diaporthe ilicicola]|nr:hypothetical protein diail_1468 [Diaporthe ilicicola]
MQQNTLKHCRQMEMRQGQVERGNERRERLGNTEKRVRGSADSSQCINMGKLYKDNRLVPAIIITAALWLFFILLDPVSVNHAQQPLQVVKVASEPTQRQPHWQPEPESSQSEPLEAPATTAPEGPATTPSSPTHHESRPSSASDHKGEKLSPEDVLLIIKTGGTSMWKRLLAHLLTTLAPERIPLENTVIYSDSADSIGAYRVIDVLANTTAATLGSPEFDVYRSQAAYAAHNVYLEAAGVDGDDWGPQGGWIVDKYKFVPLVQHAGDNWPRAKWYIYTEDDTYLFLPSVLAYLSRFDHREPHWLGSYAAKSGVVFAQGGAGFALSRGAWEASFGRNGGGGGRRRRMAEEYERYTADHCCGDQVLGHALNRYGVRLGENGGDEVFRYGFNPLVHWTFAFERWSWCLPLYSWHKVHARDVARYYELERSWDFSVSLFPLVIRVE